MELSRKLQEARRSRGLSQEALAERVGVSRQAVAKWESGQSLPEIPTLVVLSDFYGVSLDRLVKPQDDPCGSGIPATPQADDAVTAFLLRAKRATYAGHGAEGTACRPGSHDLRYEEGPFFYYDTYLGGSAFTGEEALWDEGVPFWSMNYVGRVVGEGFSGDFLKECLALATADRPFRGPAVHQNGDFLYHSSVAGEFGWFTGQEEIFRRGRLVYECRFHGGAVQD